MRTPSILCLTVYDTLRNKTITDCTLLEIKSAGSFPVKDVVLRKIDFRSLGLYIQINDMLQICTEIYQL